MSGPRTAQKDIARRVSAAYLASGVPAYANWYFAQLVAEGLQVLQNACLVRARITGNFSPDYMATRLGRAALERNAIEHVIAGGTL